MTLFFVVWLTGFLAGALLGWRLGARQAQPAAAPGRDGIARPASPAPRFEEKPGLQRAG